MTPTTQLMTELKSMFQEFKTEFKTELKTEIAEFKTELKTEIAELKTELKTEIAEIKTEAAMDDVNEVVEHIKKVAEQSSWTRSDVGVMCYLFNFMLEIVPVCQAQVSKVEGGAAGGNSG
eukprot:gene8342-30944_t